MANFIHSSRWIFAEMCASMPAALHAAWNAVVARARLAIALAEIQPREGADLLDHARLRDRRADPRRALHHLVGAQHRADTGSALDAILKREDRRTLADQPAQAFRRRLGVAHLDREDHGIGRRQSRAHRPPL
jgi:hypothetical protein